MKIVWFEELRLYGTFYFKNVYMTGMICFLKKLVVLTCKTVRAWYFSLCFMERLLTINSLFLFECLQDNFFRSGQFGSFIKSHKKIDGSAFSVL